MGERKNRMLSDLYFIKQVNIDGELLEEWVEITTSAFGLNFRDVIVALDQLDKTLIGYNIARVASRVKAALV